MDGCSTLSASLQYAHLLSVLQCYLDGVPGEPVSATLCGFCDASQKAYAGVVYLIIETNSGYAVKFVAAKTRVAPLQPQTIPRLELLAAILLSRLLYAVAQSLGSECHCPLHDVSQNPRSHCAGLSGLTRSGRCLFRTG